MSSVIPKVPKWPQLRSIFGGFIFGFCSTRVWTQSLALARQVLYHLNHTPSPFWLLLFF
jgi:hypothetical protein